MTPQLTLKYNADGLITAVAQDRFTGEVRMVAWMNQEALEQTLSTRLATFFSRSRQRLWVKGETSGHVLRVHSVVADCDADTLLLLVEPEGPSCHTGSQNCFLQNLERDDLQPQPHQPFLQQLERVIRERRQSTADKSYTRSLLDAGAGKIGAKVREEADEFGVALERESDARVENEAADVLFHLLVGLELRGLDLRNVIEVLAGRFGLSGHEEKARRKA